LGGTSNFFLTDVIRKFKWDSWNVTEDCDLGVRLKRAGLEVQVFESTTWEQALSNPKRWVRQRSRWIKGYLQTYFVHMRNPLHLLRDLGLQGFIAFQLVVGWGAFSAVINPFFWGLSITYLLTHSELIESLFPGPIYLMALISFVGGNYLYAYISLEGAIRSEQDSSAIVSLIMPIVYAPLVTIAAYKAFFEFAGSRQRAFHWAKTMHTEISKDLSVEDIAS
jgi:cellulose synthase/poly-beta-1,6-N-acetylglucosamine synthase-like glycosyltransferase